MKRDDKKRISAAATRLVDTVTRRITTSPGDRAALRRAVGRPPQHPQTRPAIAIVARHVPAGADEATERAFYAVAALIAAQPRQPARDDDPADPETGLQHPDAHQADEPQEHPEQAGAPLDSSPETAGSGRNGSAEAGTGQGSAESGNGQTDAGGNEAGDAQPPSLGTALARAVAAPNSPLKHDTIEARLHLLCRQRLDGLHRQLPRLITQLKVSRVPIAWPRLTVDLARWGSESDYVAKEWLQDYYRTYYRLTAPDRNEPTTDQSEDQ